MKNDNRLLYSLPFHMLNMLKNKKEVQTMQKFYLFTDGGGFPKGDGTTFDGVSAYRLNLFNSAEDTKLIHSEETVNEDHTGQYGEIQAIAKGLEMTQRYITDMEIEGPCMIHIYTDSMLYHNALTKWVFDWIKRMKDGVWYNSSNKPVVNQDQIKIAFSIINAFRNKNVTIRFFHINSHYPIHKLKELKEKFELFNRCKVSDEEFLFIYKENDLCDKSIKAAYTKFLENKNETNKSVE